MITLPDDPINQAVRQGDPGRLPASTALLEQRISTLIKAEQTALTTAHHQIFGDDAIDYDPSRNSRLFSFQTLTSAKELISGNQGNTLATVSEQHSRRSIAFGSNILRDLDAGENPAFASHMKNITDWLLAPASLAENDTVNVSFMLLSNSQYNQSKNWLASRYPTIATTLCNHEAQLTQCLASAHLIITGSSGSFSESGGQAALSAAAARKQSLLYVHTNSWNATPLTNLVLTYFGAQTEAIGGAGNYFAQDKANWASAAEMRTETGLLAEIHALTEHLQYDSFSFSVTDCEDDNDSCSNIPAFRREFLAPAGSLRQIIRALDASATDIFALPGQYTLEKHLILLADRYREGVHFPMSKNTTPTLAFLKSYFADHLVYHSRKYNPVPPELGNFSRTDFSHITPTDKIVTLVSRQPWRAAGVYALPGQTFSVTRTDSHDTVAASLFINTQRPSSTKQMAANHGYNRPKFLQSHHQTIKAGQTLTITSPYGGPIQIGFTDQGTAMTFSFRQIGLHPYWQPGSNDADFLAALSNNAFDWAEIATEHFEIHSRNSRMQTTLSDNSRWDTPSQMADFMTTYHHSALRALAGYQGENITPIAEVQSFATQHGMTLPVWAQVQHMNADQPTCGYGCSGNPYDAGWAFSVLGHGDLHEVGHNVESSRFKFNGFEGHATTNFYSYYPKSLAAINEPGYDHQCQLLPFDVMLKDLRQSQLTSDPAAYMAARLGSSWSQGVALVIQMMMHAQDKGKLANGWHLIPRLHLLEKAFADADHDEASWEAKKAALGFSTYTLEDAKRMDNNDWLLIAASYVTGLDYRPYLDLMGLTYSSKANAQLSAFGYAAVDKAFFNPVSNRAYCDSLSQDKVYF
ncbi:ImpA family metalloprotease [Photobacterium sp. Hal280]|uniref:ImpA family metalloprotease n=1 Tax=Photobacterium sp. Hal280 TaxID=3035163 RepID=UPI00301E0A2E